MSRPEPAIVVAAWIAKAEVDLGTARTLLRERDETAPWAACFHAQQAAEKALKAMIAAHGQEPPYGHNLVALRAIAPSALMLPGELDLATLTSYASGPRYAFSAFTEESEPSWADAETAVGWSTDVLGLVRAWLEMVGDLPDSTEPDGPGRDGERDGALATDRDSSE